MNHNKCLLITTILCFWFCICTGNPDLKYYDVHQTAESYSLKYDTGESQRMESGGFENGIWTVRGSYSWTRPDGKTQHVEFVADDKGYQANVFEQLPPSSGEPSAGVYGSSYSPGLSRNVLYSFAMGCKEKTKNGLTKLCKIQ